MFPLVSSLHSVSTRIDQEVAQVSIFRFLWSHMSRNRKWSPNSRLVPQESEEKPHLCCSAEDVYQSSTESRWTYSSLSGSETVQRQTGPLSTRHRGLP
ncbi:hypothetical protein XENOCAPTIV_015830 [Xenoophorus captivus]|uniref:Uncharacterized protein n=1 Tax=Xenoophorus captivus TaxID=1517983 RepID=A0ABV0RTB7_9TELE